MVISQEIYSYDGQRFPIIGDVLRFLGVSKRGDIGNIFLIVGLLLFVAAAYTAFWSLHPVLLLEAIMIIVGLCLILLRFLLFPGESQIEISKSFEESEKKTIASRILTKLTFGNRLRPYFPFIAIALLAFVYFYNRLISSREALGNGDYLLIGIAILLMVYNMIPRRFSVERDFVLIFLVLIFILLIVPLALYNLYVGDPDDTPGSIYIHYLVSIPATALSNLMGVQATPFFSSEYGSAVELDFPGGNEAIVRIALGCSGIYSVIIFSCAYLTFIISSYASIDRKILYMLPLGLALAWLANLIRIALTIGAGFWWGIEKLYWFHENIGILIFLAWVGLFWFIIFHYFAPPPKSKVKDDKAVEDSSN